MKIFIQFIDKRLNKYAFFIVAAMGDRDREGGRGESVHDLSQLHRVHDQYECVFAGVFFGSLLKTEKKMDDNPRANRFKYPKIVDYLYTHLLLFASAIKIAAYVNNLINEKKNFFLSSFLAV